MKRIISFPKRKSIRLKHYDYSSGGWYFVTICTQSRRCLLGDIAGGKMVYNAAGEMVDEWWRRTSERFPDVQLDVYQVMPNHIHGIIVIGDKSDSQPVVGAGFMPARNDNRATTTERATTRVAPTLGDVIGAFKSLTTNHCIRGVKNCGWEPFNERLWQRNYYENIIRTEEDLNKIRLYTQNNPEMWYRDRNNPDVRGR